MKYIISQSRDTAWNLAMEEYVLSNLKGDDYLILWVNDPCIILGKFQNVFQEIDVAAAEELGIPVFRRLSGGGCVYHDQGNLNFTFVTDWKPEEDSYRRFLDPVIRMLEKHGISAEQTGVCNLSVGGNKISGNAQTILKDRILHHGTLLFDVKMEHLSRLICQDYEHFSSKALRSVPAPVRNLREYPGFDIFTLEELEQCFLEEMGCRAGDEYFFGQEETEVIGKLALERYRRTEWNYKKAATFEYREEEPSTGLKVDMKVKDGKILSLEVISNGKKVETPEEMPQKIRAIRRLCL